MFPGDSPLNLTDQHRRPHRLDKEDNFYRDLTFITSQLLNVFNSSITPPDIITQHTVISDRLVAPKNTQSEGPVRHRQQDTLFHYLASLEFSLSPFPPGLCGGCTTGGPV